MDVSNLDWKYVGGFVGGLFFIWKAVSKRVETVISKLWEIEVKKPLEKATNDVLTIKQATDAEISLHKKRAEEESADFKRRLAILESNKEVTSLKLDKISTDVQRLEILSDKVFETLREVSITQAEHSIMLKASAENLRMIAGRINGGDNSKF